MTEQVIALVKSIAIAATMVSFGIYQGAAIIAVIAAMSRLAYTTEKASFSLFGRFFVMSLSITMLMVHVGLWREWDAEFVIIVSGISSFLCREMLEAIVESRTLIIKKIMGRLK